jgi:Flp pilus assembly pilin Flp
MNTRARRTRKGRHVKVILARLHVLLIPREEGQTMAEYAVVLGVITVALLAAFTVLGGAISSQITTIAGRI